jgi:iron complex transport system ATP-binding protein
VKAALELERVTVRYGTSAPQLNDATFTVAPGELVVIAGPNGAGKTTALRALLGVVRPVAGRALIASRPSLEWGPDELARHVAVVGQREEPAFPVTVSGIVAMGRYPWLGPWRAPRAEDRAAVERAMARTDVTDLAERWVETLSGGEWQRVRLARALAQEPRALVMDEPTAALDVRHEMELFELVSGLVRNDGLAALVVSHHLNLAARFATRLVLLAAGRIVADGAPARVLAGETATAVFGWPIAVQSLPDGTPQLYPLRRPAPAAGETQ